MGAQTKKNPASSAEHPPAGPHAEEHLIDETRHQAQARCRRLVRKVWTLALVDVDRAELRSRGRVADRKVLQSSAVTNVQPLYLQGWSARSSSTTSANMESG